MKKIAIIIAALLAVSPAFAQKEQKFTPGKGNVSFGITLNPMGLANHLSYQPRSKTRRYLDSR